MIKKKTPRHAKHAKPAKSAGSNHDEENYKEDIYEELNTAEDTIIEEEYEAEEELEIQKPQKMRKQKKKKNNKKTKDVEPEEKRERGRNDERVKPVLDYRDEYEDKENPFNFTIYFIVIFFVLLIAIILIMWDKFTVRSIEIEGLEKVNYLEVTHLSGIEYMSNIFFIDYEAVENNIEQNPVLEVTSIKRSLPSTIVIYIEEREPVAALEYNGNYVVFNKNLYALSVCELATASENILVTGTEIESYELGAEVYLTKDIKATRLCELLCALSDAGIEELIESIDITLTENIIMYSRDGYEIQIGSIENIENKCSWINTMIPKLIEEEKTGGVLYITNVDSAHYIEADGE